MKHFFNALFLFITFTVYGQNSKGIPATDIQATNGQAIIWDGILNKWKPGTPPTAVTALNGLTESNDSIKLGGVLIEPTVITGNQTYGLTDTTLAYRRINSENALYSSNLTVNPSANGGVNMTTFIKATPTKKAELNMNCDDDSPPTMFRQTGSNGNCGIYLANNASSINLSWNNTLGTDYTSVYLDANGMIFNGLDTRSSENNMLFYNTTTKEITYGEPTLEPQIYALVNGISTLPTDAEGAVVFCDAALGNITLNLDSTFTTTAEVIIKANNNSTNTITIVDNGTLTLTANGFNNTVASYQLGVYETLVMRRVSAFVILLNK